MAKTDKIDRRKIARSLYLNDNLTYEEIAEKVGSTRQTIGRWAKEDNWAELKASISITAEAMIAQWQRQIMEINEAIASREEGKRYATPAEADSMYKIAESIRKLQADLGISETVSALMRFLNWLRPLDYDKAKEFNALMDAFIKDLIPRR